MNGKIEKILVEKGYLPAKNGELWYKEYGDRSAYIDLRKKEVNIYAYENKERAEVPSETKEIAEQITPLFTGGD